MKTIHKLLALALCLALLCGAVSATMRETGTSGGVSGSPLTSAHSAERPSTGSSRIRRTLSAHSRSSSAPHSGFSALRKATDT